MGGEPEWNGVIERFTRSRKAQCLYRHQCTSVEEARTIIADSIACYNREWLIERGR